MYLALISDKIANFRQKKKKSNFRPIATLSYDNMKIFYFIVLQMLLTDACLNVFLNCS